jgi:hypothetical protein
MLSISPSISKQSDQWMTAGIMHVNLLCLPLSRKDGCQKKQQLDQSIYSASRNGDEKSSVWTEAPIHGTCSKADASWWVELFGTSIQWWEGVLLAHLSADRWAIRRRSKPWWISSSWHSALTMIPANAPVPEHNRFLQSLGPIHRANP